ncbi:MAG: sensor histidine kinase [Candidatus Krumholzibacteriia bacterium]
MDRRVVGLAFASGALFWAADAALEAFVLRQHSFLDGLLFDVRPHDLYVRAAAFLCILGFGFALAWVSERRQRADSARRESERALVTLLSNLPGMAYRCRNDRAWTMAFVSDGCVELTGYAPADLVDNARVAYSDLIHPDDREAVRRGVQTAVTARQPFELTYRLLRAGGEERQVWERGRGVFAPDGTLLALEGFVADVTKQRRAEQSLRGYAQRLKVLRDIDNGILAARSPAAIAQAAVERMALLSPCQRASVTLYDLAARSVTLLAAWQDGRTEITANRRFPLADMRADLDHLRAGRAGEFPDLDELAEPGPVLGRLREEGMRSVVIIPLVARGELLGALNLAARAPRTFDREAIEIAREVASPLALAIHHSRLHARVVSEAKEMERRAVERTADLQAFTYSVSHDLRGPLRAIDGFATALDEECGDRLGQDGQRLLEIVRGNARALRQLLDDLLAFYRLGHEVMTPAELDVAALAREEFARVIRHEPDRRARLEVAALPPAHGDAPMVRIALANLLANALKFTRPRDEAVIEVLSAPDPDGGLPAYGVRDNGVGFDPALADRLFGVFQRLHPHDEFEGTGVGLAIVRRVAERHGGRAWAEGTPDGGATFWFTLCSGGVAAATAPDSVA